MKNPRVLVPLAAALFFGGALGLVGQEPESPPKLATLAQKASYSFGFQMGTTFKRMGGGEPDLEILVRGLKDALYDQPCQLEKGELRTSVTSYFREVKQEAATKNLKEGRAFLEENKTKPGIVTLPSGLQYQVLEAGDGPKPGPDDEVRVHYRGTRIDGVEFDSSYQRGQPTEFPVGRVISGWTEALQLMKVGSKWKLFIPPDLAYGENMAGEFIRPNETLIFEVELIAIVE